MAKEKTLGVITRKSREKAARRIARLERAKEAKISAYTKNWISKQIKEIKSAMQGTRQYNPKTGKKYKSKSTRYIEKQEARLEKAIKAVPQRYTAEGDPFEVTQRELNRASAKQPSVYSETEARLFYRVTEKIWNRENIGEHDRNGAILDYYNSVREENDLAPYTLEQIVDFVIEKNRKFTDILENLDAALNGELDEEAHEFYVKLLGADNEDNKTGSPKGVSELVVNAIEEALEELFVLPNPEDDLS